MHQRAIQQVQALLDVAAATGRGLPSSPPNIIPAEEDQYRAIGRLATSALPDGNLVLFMPAGVCYGEGKVDTRQWVPTMCIETGWSPSLHIPDCVYPQQQGMVWMHCL